MTPQEVLRAFETYPPIAVRDPLMEALGLLEEGVPDEVRVTGVLRESGLFHPHVAGAFRLCELATAALTELLEGPPKRGEVLVLVRGQVRDLTNGIMSRVFSAVFGAYGEDGFKGWQGHHVRRRLLVFEQDDFDYNTFDVVHWKSGIYARVRMEPEELPYSIPLNNLLFTFEQGGPDEEQAAQLPGLWATGVYDALLSPEARGKKVYFCETGRDCDHPARMGLLRALVQENRQQEASEGG